MSATTVLLLLGLSCFLALALAVAGVAFVLIFSDALMGRHKKKND